MHQEEPLRVYVLPEAAPEWLVINDNTLMIRKQVDRQHVLSVGLLSEANVVIVPKATKRHLYAQYFRPGRPVLTVEELAQELHANTLRELASRMNTKHPETPHRSVQQLRKLRLQNQQHTILKSAGSARPNERSMPRVQQSPPPATRYTAGGGDDGDWDEQKSDRLRSDYSEEETTETDSDGGNGALQSQYNTRLDIRLSGGISKVKDWGKFGRNRGEVRKLLEDVANDNGIELLFGSQKPDYVIIPDMAPLLEKTRDKPISQELHISDFIKLLKKR